MSNVLADLRSDPLSFIRGSLTTLVAVAALAGSVHAAQPASTASRPGNSGNQPSATPEFRTFDGVGNNRQRPEFGSAGTIYIRERSGAHYANGRFTPAGASRPSARAISNAVVDQAGVNLPDPRGLSTCVYEFGQFLDHDIGLAQAGTTELFNIRVPRGDIYFDPFNTGTQIIPMLRSAFDPRTGVRSPREQVNTVTSFIDASQVYGSDAARAAWLRAGVGGRMKVSTFAFGDMPPLNDGTLANDNPLGLPVTSLFVCGDVRANEQPGLLTFQAVFLREHNWHAARLQALHPNWSDERLYQEARRIVGAEMQAITYNEFLPAILGRALPPYRGYRPGVNASLSNAFAAAAYRIGHSMVGFDIDVLDAKFEVVGVIPLEAAFFAPGLIPAIGGPEPIVRYMIASHQQATDTRIVDPLRNFLFGPPGAGGLDLAALNIQRGRDHGLADYNTLRQDFGLQRVRGFNQITSDAQLAQSLQTLYTDVNTIDPWVGLLAEDHAPNSSIGPTHAAIIIDQFVRLRDGDRFWYQNNQFSRDDLDMIDRSTLATIFQRTTGVTGVQANVFFARP